MAPLRPNYPRCRNFRAWTQLVWSWLVLDFKLKELSLLVGTYSGLLVVKIMPHEPKTLKFKFKVGLKFKEVCIGSYRFIHRSINRSSVSIFSSLIRSW